jgi:hypothetical protein
MTATPFKAISFSPGEILTRAKLNQMTNNEQWLFENILQGQYNAHYIKRTSGLKLAAGIATFAVTTKGGRSVNVYFGSFFSVGCKPIVVGQAAGHGSGRLICAVTGPGANNNWPDHTGFRMWLSPDYGLALSLYRIYKTAYGNWIALGW